jgi:exodeoxyribonuclease VII large subunit
VGVVTSLQAAALRDVLTTLRRRLPTLPVIIYPTPVQGEGAAARIAEMVSIAGTRSECDALVVCRGGGSIEDLWAYNEEVVARAIYDCPIPVITGIGHETDFTIADFVADVRAATPTAAAELVAPDRVELRRQVQYQYECLDRALERFLEERMQRIDYLSRRLLHPGERIRNQVGQLAHLTSRLRGGWERQHASRTWGLREITSRHTHARPDLQSLARSSAELARRLRQSLGDQIESAARQLKAAEAHLKHLNPQRVLERGYSITETDAGMIVRDGSGLVVGEDVTIKFARGWAGAQVKRKSG